MSHDPNNKDCPLNYLSLEAIKKIRPKIGCDCDEADEKPAADEVEQKTAAYHLRAYQRQIDEDGIEVGVSRQALDEVLRIVDQLRVERDGYCDAVNEKYCDQHSFMELKGCPLCEMEQAHGRLQLDVEREVQNAKELNELRAELAAVQSELAAVRTAHINIVMDRFPGPDSQFVECENDDGKGVNCGELKERADGLVSLRITVADLLAP